MLSHLIHILTTETGRLAEHAAAYAQLAAVESAQAAAAFRRRVLLQAVSLLLLMVGLASALVALLLLAAIPVAGMPAPWALLVLPLLPCAAALAVRCCLRGAARPGAFPELRRQLELDAELLRQMELQS